MLSLIVFNPSSRDKSHMSAPALQHCFQGQRARHQDHQELPKYQGAGAAATAAQRL